MAEITTKTVIGGLSIEGKSTVTASGTIAHDKSGDAALPAAKAGSLTTRTDNDTGVVTLSNGHGITTGMVVDAYWTGGVRYGLSTTVSGNAVTVDGGAGDNLPTQGSAVTLAQQVVLDSDFDADKLALIAASASRRTHLEFRDDSDVTIDGVEIAAGDIWEWHSGAGTNILAGNLVGSINVSCGDSAGASNLRIGALYTSDA